MKKNLRYLRLRLWLRRQWRALPLWLDRFLPVASLKTYLVTVILLATLPIAVLLSWKVGTDARSDRHNAQALLQQSAASVAQAAEQDLAASVDALTALSLVEGLQQSDLAAFEKQLRETPLRRPQWRSVFLTDSVGRMLIDTASATNAPLPRHEETRTLVFKVLARGRSAVSNVSWLGAEGVQVVVVAIPVYRAGVVENVLGARMATATWLRLLDNLKVPEHGYVGLFDGEARLVALKKKEEIPGMPATAQQGEEAAQLVGLNVAALQDASNGGQRVAGMLDAKPVIAAWHRVANTGWNASVGMASAPIDAAERAIVVSALTTMGACLLLGVSLALLLAWRLAEPLRRLAAGRTVPLSQPLPVLEIAQLRQALLEARQRDSAARRQLQRKAVEFETLFNHSPIGLAFAEDCSGTRVLYNPAMRTLMGEDTLGQRGGVQVLYRGRSLQPGEQPLMRACRRTETVQGMEMEVRVQGRAPAYVVANAVPLLDANGRARGALSAIMDISEIKQVVALWLAADAGQQSKQRLIDLAQEAGHVGFFEYRYRSDALTCTPGMRRLLRVSDETPLLRMQDAMALLDAHGAVQVRHTLENAVVQRAERISFDCRVLPTEGAPVRWLSCRMLVHYTSDGRPDHVTGTAVDATEQKEAQLRGQRQAEEEQAARLQAESANRAKDEFLTMLSHELRNPLGAITAALEVANSGAGGAAALQHALAVITRQTGHLSHMVGDLLNAGRVVTGKVALVQAPVDLAQVVQSVRSTLELAGQLAQHAWEFSLKPALVNGDAVRLEQVVTNLLANAMQYSPAGALIRVEVESKPDGSALLRVSDHGSGMAPELLPQIFDLFVQGERPLHRRGGGLGVGLTLVRRLVEQHGGTVAVDTALGQGSVFTVCLPAPPEISGGAQALDAAKLENDAVATGLAASARRHRALSLVLIEDNDDVRQSLQTALELDGHRVTAAADGLLGLDLLLALRPDAALVDIGLPGLDGFQVARRARAGGYAGRMVAMTGYGQEHSRRDALKAGFDAFLVKPLDAQQWRDALAG